jgi:type I restriction enzyme S subunit
MDSSTKNEDQVKSGYKKTKLGLIPEDWQLKKLGKLFSFRNGVNASKEDYGQGIKFVNVMDVLENTFITQEKILGSVRLTHKQIKKNLVKKGDVLFNRTSETQNEIGLTALYNDDAEAVFGGFVIRGRPKNNAILPEFNGYSFHSELVRKQIISKGQGAVRVNIGQSDLEQVKLPLPPLTEQKKIAEILTTWDKAIETLEQLIAKKEKLKKGLMQQLLTSKKRFPGFDGDWQERKLGDLINTFSGGTPSRSKLEYYGGSIPWIKSGELNTRRIYATEENISAEGLENSSAKLVSKNTLLLAIYGATAGVISVNMMEKASINQAVLALIPKNDKVDQGFLELWFSFNKDRIVHTFTQGGQPNLSAKIVKGLKIECPTIEEQRKISKLLFSISDEIESIKQSMQVIKIQKKGLMQQLLTGKKRVKVQSN